MMGNDWTIKALNEDVEAEFDALPAGLRTRLLRVFAYITTAGLENVTEPYVKHIEGKIWEIRAKGADGIARVLYITATGRLVVLLHVFVKKTQKTPKAALRIARERAKLVSEQP